MCNLVNLQGEIKAIVNDCTGTPTAKLIALLNAAGITATAEIAALLGVAIRTVQHAKRSSKSATHCANTQPIAAQPIASDATHCVFAQPIAPHARVEEKLLPPKQEETASQLASWNVADEIVSDLTKWVSGFGDSNARQWLGRTVKEFGSEIVGQAHLKLKTDMATKSVISRPLQAMISICQRMKRDGVTKPAKAAPSKEQRANMEFIPSRYGPGRWVEKAAGALQ